MNNMTLLEEFTKEFGEVYQIFDDQFCALGCNKAIIQWFEKKEKERKNKMYKRLAEVKTLSLYSTGLTPTVNIWLDEGDVKRAVK
jgi:hypothetical protein